MVVRSTTQTPKLDQPSDLGPDNHAAPARHAISAHPNEGPTNLVYGMANPIRVDSHHN
jgi:hypothetical protein